MSILLPQGYEIKWKPNRDPLQRAFADLLDWPVFTVWKLEVRNGTPAKVPCDHMGRHTSVTQPWLPFNEAWELYARGSYAGIGVKLGCTDGIDYLCGLDLDGKDVSREDFEEDLAYVRDALGFGKTYAEFSPSGRGVHVYFYAKLDEEYVNTKIKLPRGTRVEVYAYKSEKRFFTITGAKVEGFGRILVDCTEELNHLRGLYPREPPVIFESAEVLPAKKGRVELEDLPAHVRKVLTDLLRSDPKFRVLFMEGYPEKSFLGFPSQSEADFFVCRRLASALRAEGFAEETVLRDVDLAFRASALYRDKWDERRGPTTYGLMTVQKALAEERALEGFTARDLYLRGVPPMKWIIQGFLPEGIALFSGKPKTGKSFFALQLSTSIAANTRFLETFDPTPGRVLHLALEDGEERLYRRLQGLLGDQDWPENLEFRQYWPPLTKGGIEKFEEYLVQNPDTVAVVIDPLVCLREPRRGKEASLYDLEYHEIAPLQELAKRFHILILAVHHTRKTESEDIYDLPSGSTGLIARPDTLLILRRGPRAGEALLNMKGRDIPEQEYALSMSENRWVLLGDARLHKLDKMERRVFDALCARGTARVRDLAEDTGLAEGAVRVALTRLSENGLVRRLDKGLYKAERPRFNGGMILWDIQSNTGNTGIQ